MSSPGYFEKKGDVAILKEKLRDAVTKKDKRMCHATIKKTIQFMTLGIDVSSICPEIIMASATNDIVQKKLVYLYLCSCAESNSELALLAINTLVKDAVNDDNAMIRGLAIRSMLNMRLTNLVQYSRTPLKAGLADKSSYVRRNAVMAALKLFKLDQNMFEEMELLNIIKERIYDVDGQVSYNAIVAVNEIELGDGGIKFDKNLVTYLFGRLPKYNEFNQCVLLQMLTNYNTGDEEEILTYLNDLDERLKHANKGVVMAVITLFLHFTKDMDWIQNDVYDRIRSPILLLLLSSTGEIVYPILCHISVLINLKPRLFHKDFKHFFIRNNDTTYIRQKKLEILTSVVTEGNMKPIVEEIREYMHDPDILISCKAIYSIGKIALDNPFAKDMAVKTLIDILHMEVDYITANCLQTLQEMIIKYPELSSYILPELDECWEQVQHHAVGKAAVIWMYGEYGEDIPAAPYHLEELIENIGDEQSAAVKLHILTAMMKLFFKRPPECQHTLGRILKFCIDDETNTDVKDRALLYYRLTTTNVEQARAVFQLKENTLPFPKSIGMPMISKEDFHFKEFNTLSVIYDMPSSAFTHQYRYTGTEFLEPQLSPADVQKKDENTSVGILLDVEEDKGLILVKDFVMDRNEFQNSWKSLPHISNFEETFTVLPEYGEIKAVILKESIILMACSRPEDTPWKFFFYGKVEGSDAIVLVEMIIYHQENRMTVLSKSQNNQILGTFIKFFRNLFIGRWIALPNG